VPVLAGPTRAGRAVSFQLNPEDCDHQAHRDVTRLDDVDLRLQCFFCGTEKRVPREPATTDATRPAPAAPGEGA